MSTTTSLNPTTPLLGPIKHQAAHDLVLWRDPKKSGIALAAIGIVYYIIDCSGLSGFRLTCYALMLAVVGAFAWSNLGSYINKPGPPLPGFLKNDITNEQAAQTVDRVLPLANRARGLAYQTLSGRDPILGVKALVALFVADRVVAVFGSIASLAFLGAILAFVLPKVYEMKQPEIDNAMTKVKGKVNEGYQTLNEKVLKKIPKSSAAAKKVE